MNTREVAQVLLTLSKRSRWRPVQRVADKNLPALRKFFTRAFQSGRDAMSMTDMRRALRDQDESRVYDLVNDAVLAFQKETEGLQQLLEKIVVESGGEIAERLPKTLRSARIRAAVTGSRELAPKISGFAFDRTNPKALEWIEEHAAELIAEVSRTTREAIKEEVEAAFEEQFDVDELTERIADLVGDDARAETIARTETMTASNAGQQLAWDQAIDEGFLTGDEKQEWIVTPDDRLCPICEPLDGQTVKLGAKFDTELGKVDGPPAHPNCRCTVALSV